MTTKHSISLYIHLVNIFFQIFTIFSKTLFPAHFCRSKIRCIAEYVRKCSEITCEDSAGCNVRIPVFGYCKSQVISAQFLTDIYDFRFNLPRQCSPSSAAWMYADKSPWWYVWTHVPEWKTLFCSQFLSPDRLSRIHVSSHGSCSPAYCNGAESS